MLHFQDGGAFTLRTKWKMAYCSPVVAIYLAIKRGFKLPESSQEKAIRRKGWPSGLPLTQQALVINAQPFVPCTVGRRQANNTAAYNAYPKGC